MLMSHNLSDWLRVIGLDDERYRGSTAEPIPITGILGSGASCTAKSRPKLLRHNMLSYSEESVTAWTHSTNFTATQHVVVCLDSSCMTGQKTSMQELTLNTEKRPYKIDEDVSAPLQPAILLYFSPGAGWQGIPERRVAVSDGSNNKLGKLVLVSEGRNRIESTSGMCTVYSNSNTLPHEVHAAMVTYMFTQKKGISQKPNVADSWALSKTLPEYGHIRVDLKEGKQIGTSFASALSTVRGDDSTTNGWRLSKPLAWLLDIPFIGVTLCQVTHANHGGYARNAYHLAEILEWYTGFYDVEGYWDPAVCPGMATAMITLAVVFDNVKGAYRRAHGLTAVGHVRRGKRLQLSPLLYNSDIGLQPLFEERASADVSYASEPERMCLHRGLSQFGGSSCHIVVHAPVEVRVYSQLHRSREHPSPSSWSLLQTAKPFISVAVSIPGSHQTPNILHVDRNSNTKRELRSQKNMLDPDDGELPSRQRESLQTTARAAESMVRFTGDNRLVPLPCLMEREGKAQWACL
ncbi:uncharacterized protein CDV56_106416 [Aspergillus thermomutatus]|uniref:Uncharacterized protein n=1 Tax=Aspergillus thermomutatus TaxID=41047 RepID=A0A397HR17_ASPTH|nr:uncharacterized protein CDV56_106416 [Aspergillus thermomutatus]RHZ63593.1 hypothetical protein CDV56_106416 [Aspergillus thermomutatus]